MPTYSILRLNRRDRCWFDAVDSLNPYYIQVISHCNSRKFGYSGVLHARGGAQIYDSEMPVLVKSLRDVQDLEETLGLGIYMCQKGLGVSLDHTTRLVTLDFGLHDGLIIVDHAVIGSLVEALCIHSLPGRTFSHSNYGLAEVSCFSTTPPVPPTIVARVRDLAMQYLRAGLPFLVEGRYFDCMLS